MRRTSRRATGHLDRAGDGGGLRAPARAGLRALGRVVAGRRPRRRALRHAPGAGVLRRIDVLAGNGCLQGGAGEARGTAAHASACASSTASRPPATWPPWVRARSRGAISRSCWPSRYNMPRPAAVGLPPRKHGEAERPSDREPAVLRDGPLPLQLPAGTPRPLAGRHSQLPHRHGNLRRAGLGRASAAPAPSPTAPIATIARPASRCASWRRSSSRRGRSAARGSATPGSWRATASSSSARSTTRSTASTRASATAAAAWTTTAASSTRTSSCNRTWPRGSSNSARATCCAWCPSWTNWPTAFPPSTRSSTRWSRARATARGTSSGRSRKRGAALTLRLSRLLDRAEPQDGLQERIPPHRGALARGMEAVPALMLYRLARSALFQLDPETAHELALKSMCALGPAVALLGAGADRGEERTVMGIRSPTRWGSPRAWTRTRSTSTRFPRSASATSRSAPSRRARSPATRSRASSGWSSTRPSSTAWASTTWAWSSCCATSRRLRFRGVLGINIGKNFDTPIDARPTTTSRAWTRCTTARPTSRSTSPRPTRRTCATCSRRRNSTSCWPRSWPGATRWPPARAA